MKVSTRYGGIAGIVAGFGFLVQAVMGSIKPQTEVFSGTWDYILEAFFVIALLATIFGLMGLHSFAQNSYGRAGTLGFWLAVIGTILITISAIATLFAGKNSLGFAFLGGVLLSLIGYIVLGIMTWRGKVLRFWDAMALTLGFPLAVFLSTMGGGILFSLAWFDVGYFLSKQ